MTPDNPLSDHTLKRLERDMTTGAENLAIAKALAAEAPQQNEVLGPITSAIPTSVPPAAYVIHKWAKHCLTCGAIHYYSDVFALNHLKANWGFGKYVRNLTPITRPEWNVPLTVHELAPKAVPFCHECVDLAQDHLAMLPRPPIPQAPQGTSNLSSAAGGSAPKTAEGGARTKGGKAAKKEASLDDLDF